jgi:hypothetical protein
MIVRYLVQLSLRYEQSLKHWHCCILLFLWSLLVKREAKAHTSTVGLWVLCNKYTQSPLLHYNYKSGTVAASPQQQSAEEQAYPTVRSYINWEMQFFFDLGQCLFMKECQSYWWCPRLLQHKDTNKTSTDKWYSTSKCSQLSFYPFPTNLPFWLFIVPTGIISSSWIRMTQNLSWTSALLTRMSLLN